MDDKTVYIQTFLREYNIEYVPITNDESLTIIYNAYKNDTIDTSDYDDSIIYLYFGVFYSIKYNYNDMVKSYIRAICMDNIIAMKNLANFHDTLSYSHYNYIPGYNIDNIDYTKLVEYYYTKIDKDDTESMNYLAAYYHHINIDNLMEKYYTMAIIKNNLDAMIKLNRYYSIYQYGKAEINIKLIQYYLEKIKDNCIESMRYLAMYYHYRCDYGNMKKYYHMAIDNGDVKSMRSMARHSNGVEKIKYYQMAIDKGDIESINDLSGYYKLRDDFTNFIKICKIGVVVKDGKSMASLAYYYYTIHRHDKMLKYGQMAIDNGNYSNIHIMNKYYKKNKDYNKIFKLLLKTENYVEINNYLMKYNDIANYLEVYQSIYLDACVRDKYNSILLKVKNKIESVYEKMECTICTKNTDCLFKSCGHYFCEVCYGIKCRICNNL